MGVGRVPAGEQRSRFLAVGLSDNTVRIISLDPNVSKSVPRALIYPFHLIVKEKVRTQTSGFKLDQFRFRKDR